MGIRSVWSAFAAAVILACLPSPAAASTQLDTYARADGFVQDQMQRLGVPGVAYAILDGGTVVHQVGLGVDGNGAPVTADTPFLWGSVAKPVAAAVTVELARQGVLRLDDPVRAYLPGFELADHAAAARITIRDLLQHTSGLPFGASMLDSADPGRRPADVLPALASVAPKSPPGTAHLYSSLNYLVLAAAIEAATGHSYPEVLTATVGRPLHMEGMVTTAAQAANVPRGHRYLAGRPIGMDTGYDPAGVAYGYLGGSLTDLTSFAAAQLHPADPATIGELHAPGTQIKPGRHYGLGWRISDLPDQPRSVWHSGTVPGYFSTVILLPDSDRAVVMLQNVSGFFHAPALLATAQGVADLLSNEQPVSVAVNLTYRLAGGALAALALTLAAILATALVRYRSPSRASVRRRRLGAVAWVAAAATLIAAALWGTQVAFDAPPRYLWLWAPDLAILSWTTAGLAAAIAGLRVRRAMGHGPDIAPAG
ncbi:serine hydrolase domain-containing protein [Rhodococcus maanshanensis]|uniref:CubicO group peptidase, beta-lactamase class C family n=1 Tax=Rhodococcus maanshanensis TaxID=183556 RepID=A0A1H7RJH5_9NOCA|nr:serine hydrolase domain-containing protein [Rhodococcus maanshanensis]SEL60259.1 CubicO group peptidase, beta-lactamase class C family [Rhodococcus maanshanensis]